MKRPDADGSGFIPLADEPAPPRRRCREQPRAHRDDTRGNIDVMLVTTD